MCLPDKKVSKQKNHIKNSIITDATVIFTWTVYLGALELILNAYVTHVQIDCLMLPQYIR